jgi:hypothetical protein
MNHGKSFERGVCLWARALLSPTGLAMKAVRFRQLISNAIELPDVCWSFVRVQMHHENKVK